MKAEKLAGTTALNAGKIRLLYENLDRLLLSAPTPADECAAVLRTSLGGLWEWRALPP